jgi:type III restriction enzyme
VHEGQQHDYYPDFIIRLEFADEKYLILETKGYDELMEVKADAARRWVKAVNADGQYGQYDFVMALNPDRDVVQALDLAIEIG